MSGLVQWQLIDALSASFWGLAKAFQEILQCLGFASLVRDCFVLMVRAICRTA